MSVVWKLEYDGQMRPLRAWGIERPVLTFGNQVADELTFDVAGITANDTPPFPYGATLVVWRDAVRWFTGTVRKLPFSGSARGERQSYTVVGPWSFLERIIYQQPRWVLADPSEPDVGFGNDATPTSKLVLFQSTSGGKRNAGQQAQDVVDFAITKGAPIARGSFGITTDAPWERGFDLTCAEVVRRCLRWTRDAVAYWDYSAATPVLQIQRRADLAAITLDLDDANLVVEVSPGPCHELKPRGVLIRYLRTAIAVNGNQYQYIDEQTAGAADGGLDCVTVTLELAGAGPGAEPRPVNLASDFFSSVSTLQWEGQVVVKEAECSGIARPGNVLNLDNGNSDWATMNALIQSVTEDLETGETTIAFGPAEQLGPQDFLDLVRFRRDPGGTAGNDPWARNDGTPDHPSPPRPNPPSPPTPGSPPGSDTPSYNAKEIDICENGETKRIKVQLV